MNKKYFTEEERIEARKKNKIEKEQKDIMKNIETNVQKDANNTKRIIQKK